MRRIVLRQLGELGYRAWEAENAAAALAILEREPIDILLTDIMMPGELSGLDLARHVAKRWPKMRVILTSGFPGAKIEGGLSGDGLTRILSKPYRRDDLARALRQALAR
jgi:CheY-like chemotaxis protein